MTRLTNNEKEGLAARPRAELFEVGELPIQKLQGIFWRYSFLFSSFHFLDPKTEQWLDKLPGNQAITIRKIATTVVQAAAAIGMDRHFMGP